MSLENLKLLIAEDNAVNRLVVEAMCKLLGASVEFVFDGEQALHRMVSCGDRYDGILMDCDMPAMNGYEAAARIRQWESDTGKARKAIIALTAYLKEDVLDDCLAAGMDDVLTKPIKLDLLKTVLEERFIKQPGE